MNLGSAVMKQYICGIPAYIAAMENTANVVKILPVQLEEATDHKDRFKSISHRKSGEILLIAAGAALNFAENKNSEN